MVHVNVDSFRTAETARIIDPFLPMTGGVRQDPNQSPEVDSHD